MCQYKLKGDISLFFSLLFLKNFWLEWLVKPSTASKSILRPRRSAELGGKETEEARQIRTKRKKITHETPPPPVRRQRDSQPNFNAPTKRLKVPQRTPKSLFPRLSRSLSFSLLPPLRLLSFPRFRSIVSSRELLEFEVRRFFLLDFVSISGFYWIL